MIAKLGLQGKGTTNRIVGLLDDTFCFAILQGYFTATPVQGVNKFKVGRRERFVSDGEYTRIGEAIRRLEEKGVNELAPKSLQILMVTRCRKSGFSKL